MIFMKTCALFPVMICIIDENVISLQLIMRKWIVLMLLSCTIGVQAERKFNERPKLVVGIVVDQMRWDYLGRYYDQFGDDGFKRLIEEGYSCNNCLINYLPTVTSIGHTSVYTGTVCW